VRHADKLKLAKVKGKIGLVACQGLNIPEIFFLAPHDVFVT